MLETGATTRRRRRRRTLLGLICLGAAVGLLGSLSLEAPFDGHPFGGGRLTGGGAMAALVVTAPEDVAPNQLASLRFGGDAAASPRRAVLHPPAAGPSAMPEASAAALPARFRPGPPDAAEAAESEDVVRTVAIGKGDTLVNALLGAGAIATDAHAAATALAKEYDPRRLQIGQELTLTFVAAPEDGSPRLTRVALAASVDRDVLALRSGSEDFRAQSVTRDLERRDTAVAGSIDSSLYVSASAIGVPAEVIVALIRLYSYDVDFQRDIQPGDRFEVLYDGFHDDDGTLARTGDIQFARLVTQGKSLTLYRYATPDGDVDYFNEKGESARKFLMKTPIDGARLSSGFGMRRHPILGYSKMHRGTDFAAPTGTPIYAAGDGVVEKASWYGGYGRYVRLRHNGRFKTAYAHLSRFAKGIGAGKRVRQGQVIGYVGTSGRSTGPHLHYEVLVGDKQVNPMGLDLPTGVTLAGKAQTAFRQARDDLDQRFAAGAAVRVAQGDGGDAD